MNFFIGIDDTDNLESRGTGFRVRQLADELTTANLCTIRGITRHQLYVHHDIPFTSHNSSACIALETDSIEKVIPYCREFLLRESAVGSDAGLCVASENQITQEVMTWGTRAKREVLTMEQAYKLASEKDIFLEGLTGEKTGIIGSLAAVGLSAGGNDGRFLMLGGFEIRNIQGIYLTAELQSIFPSLKILDFDNKTYVNQNNTILVGEWMRPILLEGHPVLMVEKRENSDFDYETKSKDFVKSNSN